MYLSLISSSADSTQAYSRKWRIGGVLSLDLSPAFLNLAARGKTKLFPLRPPSGRDCAVSLNHPPHFS